LLNLKKLLETALMGIGIAFVGIIAVPMVILIVIGSLLEPTHSKTDDEK